MIMNDGNGVDKYVKLKQLILLVLRCLYFCIKSKFRGGLCFCSVSTNETGIGVFLCPAMVIKRCVCSHVNMNI